MTMVGFPLKPIGLVYLGGVDGAEKNNGWGEGGGKERKDKERGRGKQKMIGTSSALSPKLLPLINSISFIK